MLAHSKTSIYCNTAVYYIFLSRTIYAESIFFTEYHQWITNVIMVFNLHNMYNSSLILRNLVSNVCEKPTETLNQYIKITGYIIFCDHFVN